MVTETDCGRVMGAAARHPSYGLLLRFLWLAAVLCAAFVALFSLRYALPGAPHAARLPNNVTHHETLVVHAVMASLALLIGPMQMSSSLRRKFPIVHRGFGWAYVTAVLVGWVASVPLALHALAGWAASAGFLTLGLVWVFATGRAVLHIARRNIVAHRQWMIRSYALTFAAVTLRIYLGIAIANNDVFAAYPAISWLCWLPNLAVAEVMIASVLKQTAEIA